MNRNKYSNHKIAWFPDKLQSFRDDQVIPPIYVRVKPTNRCCHKCFFCVYNPEFSRMHETIQPADELPTAKALELLDDFKAMGVKAVTYSGGGEPLMHPDIVTIFRHTLDQGIDLSILTNAQLLSNERADLLADAKWIRVSADYCNPEMFERTRGDKRMYQTLIDNIAAFAQRKRAGDFGVNFIVSRQNARQVYDAAAFFKDLGVDNIRFSPMWTPDFYHYHLPIEGMVGDQLSHARNELQDTNYHVYDSYRIVPEVNDRVYTRCYVMQTIPVVGADGSVYACHNKAYTTEGRIGSINERSFRQLWESDETKEFFRTFNAQQLCRHQCSNDAKNVFINDLINCQGDNFV